MSEQTRRLLLNPDTFHSPTFSLEHFHPSHYIQTPQRERERERERERVAYYTSVTMTKSASAPTNFPQSVSRENPRAPLLNLAGKSSLPRESALFSLYVFYSTLNPSPRYFASAFFRARTPAVHSSEVELSPLRRYNCDIVFGGCTRMGMREGERRNIVKTSNGDYI